MGGKVGDREEVGIRGEGGRNDDKSIYSEVKEKRWDTERRLKETEEEESNE